MKTAKLFKTLFVACMAVVAVACSTPYDDTELKDRVAALEEQVATLMAAHDAGHHITSYSETEDGYNFVFSNGTSATITAGAGAIASVEVGADSVTFTLEDGTSFSIPFAAPLSIEFEGGEAVMISSYETVEVRYTVTSAASKVQVEAIGSAMAEAKVWPDDESGKTGSLEITSYYTDYMAQVVVFVTDGNSVIMRRLSFEEPGIEISDNATKSVGAEGGEVTLEFLSNVDYEVVIPAAAQEWISVVDPAATRAMESYSVTLAVAANTGTDRSAAVSVQSPSTGVGVTYYIEQTGEGGFDPYQKKYTAADVTGGLAKADYLKTWNYYAVDGFGEDPNRVFVGQVTFSENTADDVAGYDYIDVAGISALGYEMDLGTDKFPVEYYPTNGMLYVSSDKYVGVHSAYGFPFHIFTMFTIEEDDYVYNGITDGMIGAVVGDGMIAFVPDPTYAEAGYTLSGLFFGAFDEADIESYFNGGLAFYSWILLVDPAVDSNAAAVAETMARPKNYVEMRGTDLKTLKFNQELKSSKR
jgi:hypothetical protein